MGQFTLFLSLVSMGIAAFMAVSLIEFCRGEFPSVGVLRTQFPVVEVWALMNLPISHCINGGTAPGSNWQACQSLSFRQFLVSEDWAFYQHKGYDPNQIVEALKKDVKAGKFSRGASTITQQVVKNVFS